MQDQLIDQLKLEIEKLQVENAALLKLASHDMRSPLNKIFALINLLKMSDDPLSKEQISYIEMIEMILGDGLQRMRNLMDLRAIESDQVSLHWEELDVAALLNRMVREYVPLAERKNIKLVSEIDPARTMTDRLILSKILDQLLSNAIKFSPRNSSIKLQLKMGEDNLAIKVMDSGYGIQESEQKDLYKKFKVLTTQTSAGETKTGIGLYIAQENAKKLGGIIYYTNEEGSVFRLELPLTNMA